jgi:hypothetical protein
MQQLITEDTLVALGIQLDDSQMKTLVEHANETLSERVGADIVESLDDEKLEEYLAIQQSQDEEKTSAWLSENVPELKEIVENERDILLGELAENAESIK